MPRAPDRGLRRMIADLASLDAGDLDAVLGDLDASERLAIERLLDEFSGKSVSVSEPVLTGSEAACDLARFSPWMVKRLLADRFEGEMTQDARKLLGESAASLYPALPRERAAHPLAWVATLVRGGA
jgi:hypothetical protein